ncbi:MAG: hypothetical protein KA716_33420 [Gloeotrichia echinulata DEX184]
MAVKNGRQRSPEIGTGRKGSESQGQPGSMGAFSATSAKDGAYEIRTGGEDSNEPNTVVTGEQRTIEIGGKLVRQLIDENEKQLAYHEQQAKHHEQQADLLRERLQELKQIDLDTE